MFVTVTQIWRSVRPTVDPPKNDHGKLGAATAPFYLPILVISFIPVLRHGFTRDAGCISPSNFSIGSAFSWVMRPCKFTYDSSDRIALPVA